MRRALLALLLAVHAATPVHALSCLRPDMVRSWQERGGTSVVLKGEVTFDASAFQRSGIMGLQMPTDIDVPARFRGRTFPGDTAVTLDITLRSVCYANWCGALASGEVLLFAEVSDSGLHVPLDPCGTAAFSDPSEADLARLSACVTGGACETAMPPRQ
ncbi:hypothetical protein [Tropicimonas sp. S265A]|uniref:hypothetical protein n=1 Tax=Tropicimonas sp. S265A TaxID=3415134 RepID=UPI003C7A41B2